MTINYVKEVTLLIALIFSIQCSDKSLSSFSRRNLDDEIHSKDSSKKEKLQKVGKLKFLLAALSKNADKLDIELHDKNSDKKYSKQFSYDPSSEILFEDINEGNYDLNVRVFDGTILQYIGEVDVEIVSNETVSAEVVLFAQNSEETGSLIIILKEDNSQPTPKPNPKEPIEITASGLPLELKGFPVGTQKDLTLNLSLVGYSVASFSTKIDDIDELEEVTMLINGNVVQLPSEIIDTDGEVLVGPTPIEFGYLVEGENIVTFKFESNLGGTTSGYSVIDLKITLSSIDDTPQPTPAPELPEPTDGFFVSPSGNSNGDGSISDPWDFETALESNRIEPGDTLWFRSGIYFGGFHSYLSGAEDKPVTFRPFPGEHAIIDTYLKDTNDTDESFIRIYGDHTIWRDLEFRNSRPDSRVTDTDDVNLPDSALHLSRGGVYNHAKNTRFINNVVHDFINGFGNQKGEGGEMYGNIIYNNGYEGPKGGVDHGVYTWNKGETRTLALNFIFNNFRGGVQVFGSSGSYNLENYTLEGNTIFNNGGRDLLVGGGSPAHNIRVVENYTYQQDSDQEVLIGWGSSDDRDLTFKDNYFFCGQLRFVTEWDGIISSGNMVDKKVATNSGVLPSGITVNDSPSGTKVFVKENKYETGRAHITVYNWDRKSTVDVDLSTVLAIGDSYEIHHVYDVFGTPIATGVFNAHDCR